MLRVLKSDLYKMFRMPSFWVTLIIAFAFSIFASMGTFSFILKIYQDSSMDILAELGSTMSDTKGVVPEFAISCIGAIITITMIFAIMFVTSEFSSGTIKNTASKGYNREFIYSSKLISSIVSFLINAVVIAVSTYVVGMIVIGNKIPDAFVIPDNFVRDLFLDLLIGANLTTFAVMIAFIFRSTGPALGVALVYTTFEAQAFSFISDKVLKGLMNVDFDLVPYTMSRCLSANNVADASGLTRGLIVAVVYIAVMAAVGLYTFRKRDIN